MLGKRYSATRPAAVLLVFVLVAVQLGCGGSGGGSSSGEGASVVAGAGFPVSRQEVVRYLEREFDFVDEVPVDNGVFWFAGMDDGFLRGGLIVADGQIIEMSVEAEMKNGGKEIGARNFGVLAETLEFLFPDWKDRGDWFSFALGEMWDRTVSVETFGTLVSIEFDRLTRIITLRVEASGA